MTSLRNLGVAAALLFGVQSANATTNGIEPFGDFVQSLQSGIAPNAAPAQGPSDLPAMRAHLQTLYAGQTANHSFVLDGQIYDCVLTTSQPSLRAQGLQKIADPPPISPALALGLSPQAASGPQAAAQVAPGSKDKFGNQQACAANAIPMQRITLDTMARFKSLRDFFRKGANGAGQFKAPANGPVVPPSTNGHSYAHDYQYVNNYGGYARHNLWSPYVYTPWSEVFSLGQQWYVGFSGGYTQTAEVGLQNYPALYGGENSRLFIYYTADSYQSTGCYNLSCGAFVQTNRNWYLGGGFGTYSTYGGAQKEVALGFYLYAGNWWLAAGSDWVGYYPGSLYRGGQMSRYAQLIDFGGETVGSWHWPPMGSGHFASEGWTRAAYIRTIKWRDSGNGGHDPSLTASQPSPRCYTATGQIWGGSDWRYYFYFGGPGGYGC